MAPLRFTIAPEHALLTLADASGGLSALFALDAHIAHHLRWFEEAALALGRAREDEDDETRDARANANTQLEPIRALRTELAADAEAQLPEGQQWNVAIVAEHSLPRLPDTLGSRELLKVERSFHDGVASHLLAATQSLGPLAKRLSASDDQAIRALAARVKAFVASSGLG